jgi:hypothetical protein
MERAPLHKVAKSGRTSLRPDTLLLSTGGRNVGFYQGLLVPAWGGSIFHGLVVDAAGRIGRAGAVARGFRVPIHSAAHHVTACAKKQQ